jgi:hypothetical protein
MRRVALHRRHSIYLDLPSWKRGVGRAPFGVAGVDPGSRTLATIADENDERESGCLVAPSDSSGVSAFKSIAPRRRGRRRLAANIFTQCTHLAKCQFRESSHQGDLMANTTLEIRVWPIGNEPIEPGSTFE